MTARTFDLTKRLGARVAAGAVLSLASVVGFGSLAPSAHADTKPATTAHVAAVSKADANGAKTSGQSAAAGASAQDVIKLARTQVGTHEDASGNSKFNDWYVGSPLGEQNAHRIGAKKASVYKGQSWCDMFVSWLGQHTGTKGMAPTPTPSATPSGSRRPAASARPRSPALWSSSPGTAAASRASSTSASS